MIKSSTWSWRILTEFGQHCAKQLSMETVQTCVKTCRHRKNIAAHWAFTKIDFDSAGKKPSTVCYKGFSRYNDSDWIPYLQLRSNVGSQGRIRGAAGAIRRGPPSSSTNFESPPIALAKATQWQKKSSRSCGTASCTGGSTACGTGCLTAAFSLATCPGLFDGFTSAFPFSCFFKFSFFFRYNSAFRAESWSKHAEVLWPWETNAVEGSVVFFFLWTAWHRFPLDFNSSHHSPQLSLHRTSWRTPSTLFLIAIEIATHFTYSNTRSNILKLVYGTAAGSAAVP